MLIGMLGLVLIGKPLAILIDSFVRHNAVVPGVSSLIRWQSHWHVVRQSWTLFQNDFAGRIASRVMQTSDAVRECVVSSIHAVWYITRVLGVVLMADGQRRLALGRSDRDMAGRLHRLFILLRASNEGPVQEKQRAALCIDGSRGG